MSDEKRTDVPGNWLDKPQAWWEHVATCDACSRYYESPLARRAETVLAFRPARTPKEDA
jgi:hypothetical protein